MNTEKMVRDLLYRAEHCQDVSELQNIAERLEELGAYEHAARVTRKARRLAEEWTRVNR